MPFLEEAHEAGWFSNFGPLARRFEAGLVAAYGRGGECVVTASSATAGLSAALVGLGVSGKVLIPAFTFAASLGAVRAAGCEPLIVDVDEDTQALAADALARHLAAARPAAVMLVRPFGLAIDVSAHIRVCQEARVPLVLDSAAALGPERHGHAEPGVVEVFSLHATKPFAIGEGGAVFAHECEAEAIRAALNFSLHDPGANGRPRWGLTAK